MSVLARSYSGGPDLVAMQDAVSAWEPARCRTMHPGDVAHRLYTALRDHDPADIARLWEEDDGLVGWALVFPQWQAWDALAAPGRPDVLAKVLDWCEATVADIEPRPESVQADVCDCDEERKMILTGRGYRQHEQLYWVAGRSLAEVPEPEPPDGFSIRAVTGPEEAAAVAEVHVSAFGSKWTAESYRRYMGSPAYDAERELVVVAPGGRLAAFCICWLDQRNGVGLFEPVGTHSEYHRQGLGHAILYAGMRLMRERGMTEATVLYEVDNEASGELYRGVGFEHRHAIRDYRLPIEPAPA